MEKVCAVKQFGGIFGEVLVKEAQVFANTLRAASIEAMHFEASRPLAVLLGASNLRRGLVPAVEEVRRRLGAEAQVLAALGHGRSYAQPATFIVRTMPGILECGLWPALERLPRRGSTLHALLTDVGNDLVYGAESGQIAAWVNACLTRLPEDARVTLVLPPLASLRTLGPRRFAFFRRLFFPGRRLDLGHLLSEAERLAEGLRDLGRERGAAVVEPQAAWYGLDPIHVRRRATPGAWRALLGSWGDDLGGPRLGVADRVRLLGALPEAASALGWSYGRPQPSLDLGGTVLGLY